MRVYLEDHLLSDGGRARIWKLGNHYIFCRTFLEDQPPEDFSGNKHDTYEKLADCLKKDVCEVD
jgi:hypothetical protein